MKKYFFILLFIFQCYFDISAQSIDLIFQVDGKDEYVYDFFDWREIDYEMKIGVGYRFPLNEKLSTRISYIYSFGEIYPNVIAVGFGPANNKKTYHNISADWIFTPFDLKFSPYLFAGTYLVPGYPYELETYEKETTTAFNYNLGMGINFQLKERFDFKAQYAFGQILSFSDFMSSYEDQSIFGVSVGYRLKN